MHHLFTVEYQHQPQNGINTVLHQLLNQSARAEFIVVPAKGAEYAARATAGCTASFPGPSYGLDLWVGGVGFWILWSQAPVSSLISLQHKRPGLLI